MCFYHQDICRVQNKCTNALVMSKRYVLLMEFIVVMCKLYHLPSEFTTAVNVAVYLAPSNHDTEVLKEL